MYRFLTFLSLVFSFSSTPLFSMRFHPSVTDHELCELGKGFTSVGIVRENLYIDGEETQQYDIKSTGTLVSLKNHPEFDGSVILVSNHAFKEWSIDSENFLFSVNGQNSRVVQYIPAPSIDLIRLKFCCLKETVSVQPDFGFALLESPIERIRPSSLCLRSFSSLEDNEKLTLVGYGDAGRMDRHFCFQDEKRRGIETYVSEYAFVNQEGIVASHDNIPIRLYHNYPPLDELENNLVRGSIENMDSGGPIFYGGSIIGVVKGSVPLQENMPAVYSSLEIEDPNLRKKIEALLKTNEPWPEDLEIPEFPYRNLNDKGCIIDSLGCTADWIENQLSSIVTEWKNETFR